MDRTTAIERRGAEVGKVAPRSLSARAGIRVGDRILSINGSPMQDILDYHHLASDPFLILEVDRGGDRMVVEIEKEPGSPLGLDFTTDLFDGLRQCKNRCKFCFVFQTPRGMRKPLYLMDDDYRLSFLYGNFITLTNLDPHEKERIKRLRLSPLYVSVHATDPAVRAELMEFRKDATGTTDPMAEIRDLLDAGITLHTQVVACPGVNDGAILERSIRDLASIHPGVETLAVVPVGLTRFRERLFPLRPYTPEEAREVVRMVRRLDRECKKRLGTRFVFLSDEWFPLAGISPPSPAYYERFPQLENGVGMLALWRSRLRRLQRLTPPRPLRRPRAVTLMTSPLGGTLLEETAAWLREFQGLTVRVVVGTHHFWGETVTIAGLFTAADVRKNLTGRDLGDLVCLPSVMTRDGRDGEVFLDDAHISEVEAELGVPTRLVPYLSPRALLKTVLEGGEGP